jgi:hypothetical protein
VKKNNQNKENFVMEKKAMGRSIIGRKSQSHCAEPTTARSQRVAIEQWQVQQGSKNKKRQDNFINIHK